MCLLCAGYGLPSFPQTVALSTSWKPAVSAAWTWTRAVKTKHWGPAPWDPQSLRISFLGKQCSPTLEELVRIIIKPDALGNWTK